MKRIISLILVTLLVAALFVGCSKSDPVGTYKIDMDSMIKAMKEETDELKDKSDEEIKELMKQFGMSEDAFGLEIKDDGKFTLEYAGEKEEGTWKLDGSTLTLTVDNDPLECDYEDGKITMDMGDSGTTLIFVKQ
jgi:outer membrane lipoprotein-sorting protein